MRASKVLAGITVALVAAVPVSMVGAGPASAGTTMAAFAECSDGVDPGGFNAAGNSTPRSTSLFGRVIELRYNTNRCAWGKISNGNVGDEVWVDRSYNGGNTWQGKLGDKFITSGRDTFTRAYNDANVLMRACGKAGDRPNVACTGWY